MTCLTSILFPDGRHQGIFSHVTERYLDLDQIPFILPDPAFMGSEQIVLLERTQADKNC